MKRSVMRVFIDSSIVLVLIGLVAARFIAVAIAAPEGTAISHEGTAIVKVIDMNKSSVKLAHDPIPSLKWPAMTMDFKIKDRTQLQGIKIGDAVTFVFIQSNGDYLITHIKSKK